MVRQVFKLFNADIRGLHEAAYILAGLTLGSQILALVRDRMFASAFGAGHVVDLYSAAFRIPDLVFALVASLTSAYVIIPLIASSYGTDAARVRHILGQSATLLLLSMAVVILPLIFFLPKILTILFPLYASLPDFSSFVLLAQILLIQPVLLGLSSIFGSVAQVTRRFVLYALSPILYNVGIIFGLVVWYPSFGLLGLGGGVILGACLHLGIFIPLLLREKIMPRVMALKGDTIRMIVTRSLPRSFALFIYASVILALSALAATLATGSVAVVSYASNLAAVPLALIGVSYATAAFPTLARALRDQGRASFLDYLISAMRHLILWSLVASALILVLRAHVVRTILGSGSFDWDDTRLTAAVLGLIGIGLVGHGVVLLLSRAHYALDESYPPLIAQILGALVSVTVAYGAVRLFMRDSEFLLHVATFLRVGDVPGHEVIAIGIGFGSGGLLMGLFAVVFFGLQHPGFLRRLFIPFIESVLAAVVAGATTYGTLALFGGIYALSTFTAVFTQAFIAGMVGLISGAIVLRLLGSKTYDEAHRAIMRLVRRKAALPPQADF